MIVYHDININQFREIENSYFVVDGANIAFGEKDSKNKPKLANILILINKFERNNITEYKIICDRSLFYCIDDRKNYISYTKKGIFIESPENISADIFILQFAYDKDAYVISNDKFKDFNAVYDEKWVKNHRINFRIIDEGIYFDKLIFKGGENDG